MLPFGRIQLLSINNLHLNVSETFRRMSHMYQFDTYRYIFYGSVLLVHTFSLSTNILDV